ncbi:hypothetical protein ACQKP8_19710 [Photobacterium alginatilyticum]|uniref:hypothetical protein n=1 Tax=Photobacterium alginatilyticum TaxID=1775171 RepID=UPI00406877A7
MKNGLLVFLFTFFSLAGNAAELWESEKVYNAGDIVEWNDSTYISTSWSLDKEPQANGNSWNGWVKFDTESVHSWQSSEIYNSGDIIEYQSYYYLSRWWNKNATPNIEEVWLALDIVHAITDQDKIEDLTSSNQIPNLERSDSLLGIDEDNNGIRDDIDKYIELNYQDTLQQNAVRQLASALQKTLVVDISDTIFVKKINRDNTRAINCIYSRFSDESVDKNPAQVSQEIESITSNTKARLLAYLAFSKALDGTSWAIPEGDTCE